MKESPIKTKKKNLSTNNFNFQPLHVVTIKTYEKGKRNHTLGGICYHTRCQWNLENVET
jgi:hypothetical protein